MDIPRPLGYNSERRYVDRISALGLIFLLLAPSLSSQTDPRAEIANLRYHTHPNFTRIVLDIGTLREYSTGELRGPDRVYLDVLQAKLNPILQGQSFPIKSDYLSLIRIAQKTPSTVRVTAEVDFSKIESHRIYHIFDPFRIVIDIYPKETPVIKPAGPPLKTPQPPEPLTSGYSMARQLGLGVRSVVLDPGHGGSDPGCIGKSGLQEKDVALDLALALRKTLAARSGPEVVLTRESDIFIPLEDRTVVANQKRTDLFISIHVNASRNRKREGIEVFYLNFSPDPSVNETAARENATSAKNISEMKDIIQRIVRNSKLLESRDLAEKIHGSLLKALTDKGRPMKSLGVKGGPFWVLIGGEMPSVLVEVSHLSNSREESALKTQAYRERIVNGIADGIMEYIRSLGKG